MTTTDYTTVSPIFGVFFTRKELASVLKVSGRTIDRLVEAGQFPQPLHVGRSCRWRKDDILNYIMGDGQ